VDEEQYEEALQPIIRYLDEMRATLADLGVVVEDLQDNTVGSQMLDNYEKAQIVKMSGDLEDHVLGALEMANKIRLRIHSLSPAAQAHQQMMFNNMLNGFYADAGSELEQLRAMEDEVELDPEAEPPCEIDVSIRERKIGPFNVKVTKVKSRSEK